LRRKAGSALDQDIWAALNARIAKTAEQNKASKEKPS